MGYSVKEWATWKADYESGKFNGLDDLYKSYTKKGKKIASFQALKMKAAKDGWNKKKLAPKIEEARHEMYLRLAAEAGMDEKNLIAKILEMVNCDPESTARDKGLQRLLDLTGDRAPHKTMRTDDAGNVMPDTVIVLPRNGFEPIRR